MKLKAKIKSILFFHRHHRQHTNHTSSRKATTTTTTTGDTTTTTMPRNYPSGSRSMMDLSGQGTASVVPKRSNITRTKSVWDIAIRRKNKSDTMVRQTAPKPPRTRPASVSTMYGMPSVRPKRASTVQFATHEEMEEELRERQEEEEQNKHNGDADDDESPPNYPPPPPPRNSSHSSSSSSNLAICSPSTSSSVAPLQPQAKDEEEEADEEEETESVFEEEPVPRLTETQSMMVLPRGQSVSMSSDDDPKAFRKRKPTGPLHALKSLSRSTPAMSPSASPRHSDSEGQPRVSKGTKKFMRHFGDAPAGEWVLNYYSCALVADILLQGTLFITPNFFAFYSKIFGHVSRLLIPVAQVQQVQKERTARFIPNAVGLQMGDGKSYVFASLLSRDSTFKLMLHIWRKAQRMADSDSEPPSAVQVAALDDGDDSVSGSGESLTGDQNDAALPILPPVAPSSLPPAAWTADACTTATTVITNTSTIGLPDGTLPPTLTAVTPLSSPVATRVATAKSSRSGDEPGGAPPPARGGWGTESLIEWLMQGSLVKTCFRVGSVPMKVVGEGIRELWSLPRTSLLLLISTLLLLLLFASAAFMLHRVDVLSRQLGLEKYDEYDTMYEEVIQMQQRLHTAASSEIEKTLTIQLKQIATVRQSLEALMVLFNKDSPLETAQIPDNT